MTPKGVSHEPEKPSPLPAKAATADLKTLVDQLVKLGLDFAAEALPAILTRAVKEDLGSPALLEQLLRGELERREERRVRTSLSRRAGIGLADRSNACQLRLRVPAGGAAVQARRIGHLCLAAGETRTADLGSSRSRENTFSCVIGSQGDRERLLGGVLPLGGTAARDAQKQIGGASHIIVQA